MNQIMHSESKTKAVVISGNGHGPFTGNLYVNCNPAFPHYGGLGDITLMRKRAMRLKTVRQWAAEQLIA